VPLRLHRPRELGRALRELARRRPSEAEAYLDAHQEEWGSLAEADPEDAADILEALGEAAALDLLEGLETEEAAEVLEEMRPGAAADVLEELSASRAADLVEEMGPDEAADIVAEMGTGTREKLIEQLRPEVAQQVLGLLAYPPDSAGGLMTTEVAALPLGLTASEAIEALRSMHEQLESLSYVYVVDSERRLKGVLSFRDLVFARPNTPLEEVMVREAVAIHSEADREAVAELIRRYGLLGLPVVDRTGTLLGMVTVDDVLAAVQEEASEDIATMVGAGAQETVFTPVAVSIRMRLPWVLVNLGTAFLAAAVIGYYEPTISRLAILAAYMPVAASMGGNGGAQSLAVVIRSLAAGDLPRAQSSRVVRRELAVGSSNGLAMGLLAGGVAALLTGRLQIGLVFALAVWGNMTVAGLAGAGIPILMSTMGRDPAQSSNIFLTTVTDVIGFGGFLLIATLLL
jgi:magnesium transporter